ncbi:MAG: hypothetical protein AB8E82_04575 [Aureispira sp.]
MFFLILCCVLLCACTAPIDDDLNNNTTPSIAQKPDSSQTLPLQELPLFDDAAGKFSIYFPTPPKKSKQSREVDIGALTMTQWVAQDNAGQYYVVSYADYPKAVLRLGSDKQLLKGIKERLLSTLHAQTTQEETLSLKEGHQGIAFKAVAKRQHWHLDYHLYLVNQRLYQLGIHSAIGPIQPQDSLDFFGNFKLME